MKNATVKPSSKAKPTAPPPKKETGCSDIEWEVQEVELGLLKPYEHNPRKINQRQFQSLIESFNAFGYCNLINISPALLVYDGHHRLKVMKQLGYGIKTKIKVMVSNRHLTPAEHNEFMVRMGVQYADLDFDKLANQGFSVEDLVAWGVPEYMMIQPEDRADEQEEKPRKGKLSNCPHCGGEL